MILTITDDFDLERIAESGQCFRWEKLGSGSYRILHGSACLYAESLGKQRYAFSCEKEEFDSIWQAYFDLNENYARIRSRIDAASDPFLWYASQKEKGIRILRQDPWEALVSFIISQNRNIPAIRRSVALLARTCGSQMTDMRGREYYAFPSPASVAALDEPALDACRLGYRWKYVLAAARSVASGETDLKALETEDDETVLHTLTGLYGVGIKVASCAALFGLHRTNSFPKDVWIRRVLAEKYPDGFPFERYAPYNGVFQQYLFACYRNRASRSLPD